MLQNLLNENLQKQDRAIERGCAIRLEKLQKEYAQLIKNKVKIISSRNWSVPDYKVYFVGLIHIESGERVGIISKKQGEALMEDLQAVFDICASDTVNYKRG